MTKQRFFTKASCLSAGALALLMLSPAASIAAECFDREAQQVKAGNATAVVGPSVGRLPANSAIYVRPDAGEDIFTGDRIRTGADSHLQLKLCDWSTYTFSPDSESDISEFYDADGVRSRRLVNFVRGGFRLASGRDTVAGSTEVEIQESGVTMGVRGTNVLLVELDGVVYALLEGPIIDNTGLSPQGRVEFWTEQNRADITARLFRPGWAVRIGSDGVSEPFRADDDLLRRIYQAFVPVVSDDSSTTTTYNGAPGSDSGQGAQDGGQGQQFANNQGETENTNTEFLPEQPSEAGVSQEDRFKEAFPIQVGDIIPLDALEEFASAQNSPDGVIFAIGQAQLFIDAGNGSNLADTGIVIIQIHVDWANRTIAPEALASFVAFDFSVNNPGNLVSDNPNAFNVPEEVLDAYIQALLSSSGINFADGADSFAIFLTPLFNLSFLKGPNDTVTAKVDVDFNATDNQSVQYKVVTSISDLSFSNGEGQLAFFDYPLANVSSPGELDALARNGTALLTGFSNGVGSTLGEPVIINGVAIAQIEVNFDNRTVGGGSSFLAVTATPDVAIGGQGATKFIPLDQAVNFDSGLFGLAFFPVGEMSSDSALLKGQTMIGSSQGLLIGDIASLINTDNNHHLYTEVELTELLEGGLPVATLSDLNAQSALFGTSTYTYNGTFNGRGTGGPAIYETAGGVFYLGSAEAAIEVNFGNRTLGGGDSFVSANFNAPGGASVFNFTETMNIINFDDGADGFGAFGLDGSNFNGSNIDAAMLLIRSGQTIGAGESADFYFTFTDGAGGGGGGQVENMTFPFGG